MQRTGVRPVHLCIFRTQHRAWHTKEFEKPREARVGTGLVWWQLSIGVWVCTHRVLFELFDSFICLPPRLGAPGPDATHRVGALCHRSRLQRSRLPWNSTCILSRASHNTTRGSARVSGLSSLTELSVLWCGVQCQLCSVLTKPEITL